MTVQQHLRFYGRVHGLPDIEHNVSEVMRAVGIEQYASRIASKLSGGSKRKLSLAIALIGNPSLLLLDEPGSGMDAISKRTMWRILKSVIPGRSVLLTVRYPDQTSFNGVIMLVLHSVC
jgi:ATP-binding cassette subfamily A (ABC1) protein 3